MNLYISCDGGASQDVVTFVNNYSWEYGRCEVIQQEVQLGVDQHNLACMKLAEQLGNVVVLEDDLVVSPAFQSYLLSMESLAKSEKNLAGISLYRYPMVEQDHFSFELIPNDEFVYYQQRSSSNGCFYTWDMLQPYFVFLETFNSDFNNYVLPQNVMNWGDEVWEKSFYCYVQQANKYVAFPRYSLTSDFADIGVHMKKQTNKYAHQSMLFLGKKFSAPNQLQDSDNVYDAFYELVGKTYKKYVPELIEYDLEVDIYGNKNLRDITAKYVLSSKRCATPILGWARRLKPEVNNILLGEQGDFYSLGLKEHFSHKAMNEGLREKFLYYYPDTRLSTLIKMKFSEIISRFRK